LQKNDQRKFKTLENCHRGPQKWFAQRNCYTFRVKQPLSLRRVLSYIETIVQHSAVKCSVLKSLIS